MSKNKVFMFKLFQFFQSYSQKHFTYYVVDLVDDIVMFSGKYQECDEVIDTLPGGTYDIVTKRYLSYGQKDSLKWILK